MLWMMRREAKRRRNEKAIKMRCISVKGMHRFLLYENQIPQGTTLASFRKISADFCGTHSAPLQVIPRGRDDARNDSNPLGTARDCRQSRFCRNNP